jgi:hypothetical protein
MIKPINVIRAHIVVTNGDEVYEAPVIDNALLLTLNIKLGKKHKAALGLPAERPAYVRVLVTKPAATTDLNKLADNIGFDPDKPPAFDIDIKEG